MEWCEHPTACGRCNANGELARLRKRRQVPEPTKGPPLIEPLAGTQRGSIGR